MVSSITARARLVSNILWNYAAGFASVFGLLLLYPVAVRIAGVESYGLWVLAFGAIQLFSMTDFGLGSAIVRQLAAIPDTSGHRLQRRLFATVALTLFILLAAALTGLFCLIFPLYLDLLGTDGASHGIPFLVPLTAAALFVSVVGRALNSILWAENRPDIERKASLAALLARGMGYAFVLMAGGGLAGVVLVEAATLAFPPLVCAIVVARRFGPPVFDRVSSVKMIRDLVRLSGVLFVGTFSLLLAFHLPLYVVGSTFGLASVTAFGAVMRIYQSVRLLLSWTANPFIHQISTVEARRLGPVFLRSLSLNLLLGIACSAPVIFLGRDLLGAWLGEDFAFAGPVLSVVAFGIMADAIIQPTSLVVNLRGNPWRVSWGNLVLLLAGIPLLVGAAWMGNLVLVGLAMTVPPLLASPLYLKWAFSYCPGTRLRARGISAAIIVAACALIACWVAGWVADGWWAIGMAAVAELVLLAGVLVLAKRRGISMEGDRDPEVHGAPIAAGTEPTTPPRPLDSETPASRVPSPALEGQAPLDESAVR